MSCSYGPGRYDTNYEEKGIDYPAGYARWTENRNMQAFIDLLILKKIDIQNLITHIFPLEQAPEAYNLIVKKSEPFAGLLIQYDIDKKIDKKVLIKEESINSSTESDISTRSTSSIPASSTETNSSTENTPFISSLLCFTAIFMIIVVERGKKYM